MKRREFLKAGTLAGAAALQLHSFPYHLFAAEKSKNAQDIVTLGKTGIKLTRLAQGTGTVGYNKSSNQTRKLGIQGLAELLRAGVDQGLNFWDCADSYGSHPHVREALKGVKREKVVIMTKTWATSESQMRSDLERFRQELGTDYIDILLLHCMQDTDWPQSKKAAMAVVSEAKEKKDRPHSWSIVSHDWGTENSRSHGLGGGTACPAESHRRPHGRGSRHRHLGSEGDEVQGKRRYRNENPGAGRYARQGRRGSAVCSSPGRAGLLYDRLRKSR
jgi:hypothetical protein